MKLNVGDLAPDFELNGVVRDHRQNFKLSSYRGSKPVVLAFYAVDFSPSCALQMPGYQADLASFAALNAQILGISPDSPYCHIAWQRQEIGWLDYPLLSDFWPHGEVARKYGVLRENPMPLPGISERAVFVVDEDGKIAFAKVYDLGSAPPNEEVLEILRRLYARKQAKGTSG
jgi:peroxiredoxin (alkyl hydroperoxide reductase subunit C)